MKTEKTHSSTFATATVLANVCSFGTGFTVRTSDDATAAMKEGRRSKRRIRSAVHPGLRAGVAASLFLFLLTPSGIAATYFRGNEVVNSAKPVATIERLTWTPSPGAPDRDRIQGLVSVIRREDRMPSLNSPESILKWEIDSNERKADYIVIVLQSFDVGGHLLSSVSVTPRKRLSKQGGSGGFFVDLPKEPNAYRMKVVNVVVGESEVQYGLRMPENRLVRSLSRQATPEDWTAAEFWEEGVSGGWLPPTPGSGKSAPDSGKDGASPGAESSALSKEGPPTLYVAELVSSIKAIETGTGLDKSARGKFAADVKKANLSAEAKWKKLGDAVSGKLAKMAEKAVSDGDLELMLKLESLKDAPLDVGDVSGYPGLKALREAVDAQLSRIRRELASEGLAAAKTLNGVLDGRKVALMKTGSLESAKVVRDVQKDIQSWAEGIKGGEFRKVAPKAPAAQAKPAKSEKDGTIVTVNAANITGVPIGKVKPGDVVEIEYVGGKWSASESDTWTSPDEDSSCSTELGKLQKVERTFDGTKITRTVFATIPCGTKGNPFRYTVPDGKGGELTLRKESTRGRTSSGFVRYSVKIIRGGGASAWAE